MALVLVMTCFCAFAFAQEQEMPFGGDIFWPSFQGKYSGLPFRISRSGNKMKTTTLPC